MAKKKKVKIKIKNIILLLIFVCAFIFIGIKFINNEPFVVDLKTTNYELDGEIKIDYTGYFKKEKVTDNIEVEHKIDNSKIGNYQVKFIYTRKNKEYVVEKTIKIIDKEKPVLTLKNGDSLMIVLNNEFTEPGYEANDNYDGDLTNKVEISGKVDVTKEGEYNIKYTVSDSSGNKAVTKRKVIVTSKSPLTMTLKEYTLNGYYNNVLLKETEMASEEYLSDFVYVGDSTALYYVMNKVISGKYLWHKEGLTLNDVFTQKIYINHVTSNMTIVENITSKKPKKILLMLGTNSVATMEVDYFISQYRKLLQDIKSASPETLIIVQSIFPVASSLDTTGKALNNDKINKFNYHLLKLCSELNIPFLNTAEALKDANGQGKAEYFRTSGNENGVHLTQVGNQVAMDYFKTHVYEN